MAKSTTTTRGRKKADREFISEAEEILEVMRGDIADLRDGLDAPDDVDPDLVNRLFRSAHSLKALAGMFRFDPIQDLAHQLEEILDGLRLGRVALAEGLVGLVDETVSLFASLLERVGDTEAVQESGVQIADLHQRIQAATASSPPALAEFAELNLDPSLLRALTEYEEHRLRHNIARGRHIILVGAMFEIIAFEEGLSELSAAIRENGEVISTLPAPGEAPESQIHFSLLVASAMPESALAQSLGFPSATTHSVWVGRAEAEPLELPVEALKGAGEPAHGVAPSPAPEIESLQSISDTVRVDIRKLDELMNLVGELVIQRSTIGDLIARLSEQSGNVRIGNEFAKVHKALDRKLRELQSSVLEVRMVPLRQVFEKISRVVRRIRRDLDKDVGLEIRGADTELDKLIVEALVDPLMHVVRNSVDHAIESPEERRAAGKEPSGRITVDAFQRGNHVVIAVADDGRGIDTVQLRERAEDLGVIESGEVLSEKEALELIFTPGFSTRAEVTETSGRGVGMDVVRANITALGGMVHLDSTLGRGTKIEMTLPITLAIIQSLIVGVGSQRFAIPLNAVLETLFVEPSEIQVSEGQELINLRGEPLLLRRLATEFGLEHTGNAERPHVIVLGMGEQRVGLLVDRLEGQQDTVIKPIQGPVQTVRGIAGATELGDKAPVLVLDVSALVEDSLRRREAA